MNALRITALVLVCCSGMTSAQTNSYNLDGNKLSFEKGATSTLFQSVASFDGNQLLLSNNSAVAVEAVVRDRNGNVIATTLIPPAKGGPLGEILDINIKGTAENLLNSIRTGTEVTASVVKTGLTAEDIKQGVSIEIVAGTKRAQALTAISILMDGISIIADNSGVVKDLDFKKPLSRESVVVLTQLADKVATDGSLQALMLGQGKIGPVIRDAVKDAFVDIAKDYASQQSAHLLIAAGGPQVKAALTALDGVKDYENGIFVGLKLFLMAELSAAGPTSTGFLTLKIDDQSPGYLLKGNSETYKLQIRSGFLGMGGAADITPVPMVTVPPVASTSTPVTNANENMSLTGTSIAISNPNGIGLGYAGAFAHATSATTADYHKASGSQWTATSNGVLLAWDLTTSGSLSKGNIGTAQVVGAGSTFLESDNSTMYWGRWNGATVITANSGGSANGFSVPYVYGNAAVSLPAGKTFTYTYAGGTPMLLSGVVQGQSLPGGTITVNTTARSIQLNNLAFGYNAGSVVGAATFSMSGSGSYSSNTNPGGFGGVLTGNCTGGSCGAGAAATGGYAGRFTGTTGTGIGLVYGAVTTAAVGPPAMPFIGGTVAAAFKR